MKKKLETATIGNVLRLFSKKLEDYKGESKRSYQKAFSSLQLYTIGNYSMSANFESGVVENWVIDNIIQGLTKKTVSFYLEKISSLYSGIAHRLIGGRESLFKNIKKKLKEIPATNYSVSINRIVSGIQFMAKENSSPRVKRIIEALENFSCTSGDVKDSFKNIWGSMALKAGVLPDIVKGVLGSVPKQLEFLNICEPAQISVETCEKANSLVKESLKGEEPQWFAMRLRPKIKFERILERFSLLSDSVKLPELFYPCEEIAKKINRKLVWSGKPVIRDVVFFRTHKNEIYPLFTKLYDLAWCYRTPGGAPGSYAPIPSKAMEDFKKALGFLSPDFEVMPAGEMELKPGDKVIIVNGEYALETAEILKKPIETENGNKIYRVTLLNQNGHWDIGIDARLLKKK